MPKKSKADFTASLLSSDFDSHAVSWDQILNRGLRESQILPYCTPYRGSHSLIQYFFTVSPKRICHKDQ